MATRFQQNPTVAWRLIDGEAVLIVPDKAQVKTLNRSATHLWQTLVVPRTSQELVDAIVGRFDIAAAEAATDVDEFLHALLTRGLVVEVDG